MLVVYSGNKLGNKREDIAGGESRGTWFRVREGTAVASAVCMTQGGYVTEGFSIVGESEGLFRRHG